MCGICGKVYADSQQPVEGELIRKMADVISHRGPDDDGYYLKNQVGLGHRRLSIIDLNTGKQPISNENRTVWTVFNGEIYNYKELLEFLVRKEHRFSTETDTEVLVHLFEEFGPDMVERLRGMFAFAIWDENRQQLFLARDRVGIKPLYFTDTGDALLFASEIKSILQDPTVSRDLNLTNIDNFLTYLYTPGSQTMIRNIFKLDPGEYLLYDSGKVTRKHYWDLYFDPQAGPQDLPTALGDLDELLKQTVRDHMISDVPVGVLLSGGVDSTAMLSYAREMTDKPLSSFTIGFEGKHFVDERPFARLAAEKFGSKHHEMTITADDFMAFLPRYVWHMEEPVNEAPAVALYYVSKLASEHVKVVISGEGGDEAFAGYPHYRYFSMLEQIKNTAGPLKTVLPGVFQGLSHLPKLGNFTKYAPLANLPMSQYYWGKTANPHAYFNRIKDKLYSEDFREAINGTANAAATARAYMARVQHQPVLNRLLYVDSKTWLPDDLLIKADKITMANSIELRVPFLDHKVLEFAARLPVDFKMNGAETKYTLKQLFKNRIPPEILNRPKAGFPVPDAYWYRHELKHVPGEILLDSRAVSRGYFRTSEIERLIKGHQSGTDYGHEIFSLIVLELWHRQFVDQDVRNIPQ